MIERICKECGRTIQIPEELEEFSCVFCGHKMHASEFAPLVPQGESDEADRAYVLEHLIDPIANHPKYAIKYFSKKKYENSFYDYKITIREIYEAMDRYVLANPYRRAELIDEFSNRFLEDWEKLHWEQSRRRMDFADKMTLALYEVPAILQMELSVGWDYVQTMHDKFVARYPKNVFEPATFDQINDGFRKRKWCFITTAICTFEGKPDDCAELQSFRAFRDDWMLRNGDEALVEEYYEIAPAIVNAIDFCDDREARYAELRRDYLQPCYEALQRGDYEDCRTRYVAMVRELKACYGLLCA